MKISAKLLLLTGALLAFSNTAYADDLSFGGALTTGDDLTPADDPTDPTTANDNAPAGGLVAGDVLAPADNTAPGPIGNTLISYGYPNGSNYNLLYTTGNLYITPLPSSLNPDVFGYDYDPGVGYTCGNFAADFCGELDLLTDGDGSVSGTPLGIVDTASGQPGHAIVLVSRLIRDENDIDGGHYIYSLVEPQSGAIVGGGIGAWTGITPIPDFLPDDIFTPYCDDLGMNPCSTVAFPITQQQANDGYVQIPDSDCLLYGCTSNTSDTSTNDFDADCIDDEGDYDSTSGCNGPVDPQAIATANAPADPAPTADQPAPDACDDGSDADPATGQCG